MIGKPEKGNKHALERREGKVCPLCGSSLREGLATLPFILDSIVAVVKDVPAEICEECDEPYMRGDAVDKTEALLQSLKDMAVEVSVIHYKAA